MLLRRASSPPNPILSKRPASNSLRPGSRQSLRSSRGASRASRRGASRGGTPGALITLTGGADGEEQQIIYRNGNKYVGNVLAGKPYNWGTYWISRSGHPALQKRESDWRLQYEGQWFQGKRHGKGTMYYRGGESYKGDFVLDRCHGVGQYRYANGDIHFGYWEKDKKQGKGVLIAKKDKRCNIFVGFWTDGRREGLGTSFWTDSGHKYIGEWVRDEVKCGEVKPLKASEVDDVLAQLPHDIVNDIQDVLEENALRREAKRAHAMEANGKARPGVAKGSRASGVGNGAYHGSAPFMLPQIELASPNAIIFDDYLEIRSARTCKGSPRNLRDAQKLCGTLGEYSLAKLKNAFTGLSDSNNKVYPGQLRQLCMEAGIKTASTLGMELLSKLVKDCTRDKCLNFEDFIIQVATFCNITNG